MTIELRTPSSFLPLLALSGVAACAGTSHPGTLVQLVSSGASLSEGQEIHMAGSGRLRVDALRWTSSEIELIPCPIAWRRVADWFVPPAYAHGSSTPTRLATPVVESAEAAVEVTLGELRPPAGAYCSVRVRVAPADADASGLESAPEMLGRSFLLRGAIDEGSGELTPFVLSSQLELEIERPIELVLSAGDASAVLRFERDVVRTIEALELGALAPPERDRALLDAFVAALEVDVE